MMGEAPIIVLKPELIAEAEKLGIDVEQTVENRFRVLKGIFP